ncbi:inhibitor of apoptosis-promoting Bax1-domain-containing protein [Protomyces lactucae-debilis]|uniref:Inhibitor of apoptosis-promoting Bax1-domain-containing protein n=1 Tax=Protomyces lactucae-debilis TaxID=2754530 RepID=A0A1Y2FVB1_PROLT|nr:inhibitor of apoptosis-promoting Bax1-domain-containing protein [Protomyces lactucae-debilis]ORY87953.1 inhibitor of apoptosis-promoting Bax1-domain-containing protein [Protomyces lactucae-debilis]
MFASSSRLCTRSLKQAVAPTTLLSAFKPQKQHTKRFLNQVATSRPLVQGAAPPDYRRLGLSALAVGGTLFGTHFLLNRETRDALHPYEAGYLNETFTYTGAGLALTAVLAKGLHNAGWSARMMAMNPWMVMGVGLVGSIGSMMGVMNTDPEHSKVLKHACWVTFQGMQAATLAPLFFMNPAILARAGLYTVGIVGSLSYIGATAKSDQYLYLGGPLLAGVVVVALAGLAPMVLPARLTARALAPLEAVSLYGGLAVFSGFVLYDTQKILARARMAQAGRMKRDTCRESVSLELDCINIFVRLVSILGGQGNNRRH